VTAVLPRVVARLRAASARLSDDAIAPIRKAKPMAEEHFLRLEVAYWLDKVAGVVERVQRR
jgi:hypothetical protein